MAVEYKAYLDNREITVYDARVSKIPFNRVWHGKQRDLSQTEISHFVSFDMEKAARLRIDISGGCEGGDSVTIRPQGCGVTAVRDGNSFIFKIKRPQSFIAEFAGGKDILHVFANPNEDYSEYIGKPDTLYFGKGVHDAGLILPRSGQTVILDEGAVVYGCIYCYKADNVKILGHGILDGSRLKRGNEVPHQNDAVLNALEKLGLTSRDIDYYSLFNAYECKNLTLDGIILRDAPLWTVILRNNCENVTVNNIKIIGQWRYNSDGVDFCTVKNGVFKNSFVRSFDDCFVVRGVYLDGERDGCENITAENNVLMCDWGKNLEIWSGGTDSEISNITFRNNDIIRVAHVGISIDTWGGSKSICVRNVRYENIRIDTEAPEIFPQYQNSDEEEYAPSHGKKNGVYINVGKLGKAIGNQQYDACADTSDFSICYENIAFENVTCSGKSLDVFIGKKHLKKLENITFTGCRLGSTVTE